MPYVYKPTTEEMLGDLQEGKCEIIFQKVDGSMRHMSCTLNPSFVPNPNQKVRMSNAPIKHQEMPNVIPVWDLEKMAWRSFRVDSVLYFSDEDKPVL